MVTIVVIFIILLWLNVDVLFLIHSTLLFFLFCVFLEDLIHEDSLSLLSYKVGVNIYSSEPLHRSVLIVFTRRPCQASVHVREPQIAENKQFYLCVLSNNVLRSSGAAAQERQTSTSAAPGGSQMDLNGMKKVPLLTGVFSPWASLWRCLINWGHLTVLL